MNNRNFMRRTSLFVAALLLSAAAQAQLFRAYLAPSGSDANNCTLPLPCRLLPAALAAVASGGEIWILDSGNYNTAPVNITKSVTILAVPGALGSVVAAGGDAIDIATAGVNVTLRNLVIVPLPGAGGTNGINMTLGASLVVENCLIANLPSAGITLTPTSSARLRVADSTIRGNGSRGIEVFPGTASTTTVFDIVDTSIDGNTGAGVFIFSSNATAAIKGAIRNSRISENSDNGLGVESGTGASVVVTASHNSITDNAGNGIISIFASTKVWAAGNTVSGNGGTGLWAASSGVLESGGNNEVRNNGVDTSGVTSVPRV